MSFLSLFCFLYVIFKHAKSIIWENPRFRFAVNACLHCIDRAANKNCDLNGQKDRIDTTTYIDYIRTTTAFLHHHNLHTTWANKWAANPSPVVCEYVIREQYIYFLLCVRIVIGSYIAISADCRADNCMHMSACVHAPACTSMWWTIIEWNALFNVLVRSQL